MLIRMTGIATTLSVLVAAGAVTGGGFALADSPEPSSPAPTALVIDAELAAQGRELVDPRLREVDAEVRLPRTPAEARTNVRSSTGSASA